MPDFSFVLMQDTCSTALVPGVVCQVYALIKTAERVLVFISLEHYILRQAALLFQ